MLHYDLIIVGGGLVGAGLAVALRQSNVRIALVDARLPGHDDPRLFALNNSSCQFLENLNIWTALAPHAAAIHQVHVSHQGRFGAVRLRAEDLALPTLGHVVPACYIEEVLNEALASLSNCTTYRPAKLHALHQQDGFAQLKIIMEDKEIMLQSPLVIGADGTESTVRKQLNIVTDIVDYQQSALVTRTSLQRSHQQIAYERFHSQGAIAMLPLVGNECATIWTADHATIEQLMSLSDAAFLTELQSQFGYRLGRLLAVSKRHVFPLRMVRAKKAVEQCVFLLGNSAHTLSPIAAQGFNLALYEVAVLVEGIVEKMARQETFTAMDLEGVNAKTQKQQAISVGISHRLAQLFSQESHLMTCLIQLGMVGLDIAAPIKSRLLNSMMGRRGQVPHLFLSQEG